MNTFASPFLHSFQINVDVDPNGVAVNTPGAYAFLARLGENGDSALYMDNNISAIGNIVRSGDNLTNVTFQPTQCVWNGGAGGFQGAAREL